MLFIQDEFRWVDRTCSAAEALGVSVVFTVVNQDVIRKIYRTPYFNTVRFEQTLTGFVPEGLIGRAVPGYHQRTVDVSYRARKLPGWCGSFARQKWQIAERFAIDCKRLGLKFDYDTTEAGRIYGEKWIEFVSNSKATLGTESGASFVDYTGEVYAAIDEFERANPAATFDEVRDRFLEGRDGQIVIHVISPRCFEAAALRTLMILYPGDYSGILEPGRHYVELQHDHSNMDEVVAVLMNPDRAGKIIERAYTEVAVSGRWSFRTFVQDHFDRVIEETVRPRLKTARADGHAEQIRRAQVVAKHEEALVGQRQRMALLLRLLAIRSKVGRMMRLNTAKHHLGRLVRTTLPPRHADRVISALGRVRYAAKSVVKSILLPNIK